MPCFPTRCVLFSCLAGACLGTTARAAVFELAGNVAAIDDVSSAALTVAGITASLGASTGTLNSTTPNFGINAAVLGDVTDEIDAVPATASDDFTAEALTIVFDQDVRFISFAADSFAADGSTVARYTFSGPGPGSVTGVVSSAGVQSVDTFLAAGQPAVFTADVGAYSLDRFTVIAVPEPGGLLAAGLTLTLWGLRRRSAFPTRRASTPR